MSVRNPPAMPAWGSNACSAMRPSGGELSKRSEAFILGRPLVEIASALGESGVSEIVLASGAAGHFTREDPQMSQPEQGRWLESELPSGSLLLRPGEGLIPMPRTPEARVSASPHNSFEMPAGRKSYHLSYARHLDTPKYANSVCSPEEVVRRMRQNVETESAAGRASANGSLTASDFLTRVDSFGSDWDSVHSGEQQDLMGADALLRFTPDFVRQKLLDGHSVSVLMEHRLVTVLFIVADMQVRGCGGSLCRRCTPLRCVPHATRTQSACCAQRWRSLMRIGSATMQRSACTGCRVGA